MLQATWTQFIKNLLCARHLDRKQTRQQRTLPSCAHSLVREKDKGKKTNNIIITISKYPLTKRVHRRQGVGRGTEILWLRDVV